MLQKTLRAAEQNREDVKAGRDKWRIAQPGMDADRLVFINESGVNAGMTRLYGRGANGEKVVDYTPDARFKRASVFSSVRLSGDLVPLVFKGSLNGELFKAYIAKFLVLSIQDGDIVVIDNLTAYKVKGVADLILTVVAEAVISCHTALT